MSASQEQEKTYNPDNDSIECFNCHGHPKLDSTIECDICGCLVCNHKDCVDVNLGGTGFNICESCRCNGRSDEWLAAQILNERQISTAKDKRIAELEAQLAKRVAV